MLYFNTFLILASLAVDMRLQECCATDPTLAMAKQGDKYEAKEPAPVTYFKVVYERGTNFSTEGQVLMPGTLSSSSSLLKDNQIENLIKSADIGKINRAAYDYAEDDDIESAKKLWKFSVELTTKDTKDGESNLFYAKGHYGALLLNGNAKGDQEMGAQYLLDAALHGERSAITFLLFHDKSLQAYFSNPDATIKKDDAIGRILNARKKDEENIWKLNS
jgi:hypothetical protein